MVARARDARKDPGILAACIKAWALGEVGIDADVAVVVVAETVLALRGK